MTGADERAKHPDGPYFRVWFQELMGTCTTCVMRDILRAQQDNLWNEWKRQKPLTDAVKSLEFKGK